MTFPKRARQLVSKQRALWHDDAHTAIRLLPEAKEEVPLGEYLDDDILGETDGASKSDDLLLYLARKNVREKRSLAKHFVAFIAALPTIVILYEVISRNLRHPAYYMWNNLYPDVDTTVWRFSYGNTWAIMDMYAEGQDIFHSLTHPIMYGIIGIMIAWGVWIFVRCVNAITNNRGYKGKTKPDPVQVEYQRLKSMGVEKF